MSVVLRVYGITYDHTTNYGSCLQAYALQQAIESISVQGENCQYRLIPMGILRSNRGGRKSGKAVIKALVIKAFTSSHRKVFQRFESSHMKYASVDKLEQLSLLDQDGDAFVCGSDVIWNPLFNGGLGAFYLDFTKNYKFSYAASFGTASVTTEAIPESVIQKISDLNQIGVREKSGKEFIEEMTNREAKVVLDPVLLLKKDEWERTLGLQSNEREQYIFVYTTHSTNEIDQFINMLSKQTKLKVITSTWRGGAGEVLKQGITKVQPPDEWLTLLSNAEHVVTNSFHATAFSVLFHKKFFTVVNGDKSKGNNVRINDFLTTVGLEDRIFSELPADLDLSDIDYTDVDKKISSMREESLQFLRQNLETAFQRKKEQEAVSQ